MNSVLIFHENVTYILKEKILKYTLSYINNVSVRGLETWYELKNEIYETLVSNPRIRKFVFEHLTIVN